MLERTEKIFGLKPAWLAGDTAYGIGRLLAWLWDKGITPHIPVWDRYERTDGMFSRLDFTYDAERDVYVCPNHRLLRTTGTVHDGRVYTLGTVGHLHCLDAATGKVLWAKDFVKDHGAKVPKWGFAAIPIIAGDLVPSDYYGE